MTTLDLQESLLTYIYNLLTNDATLKSNMGGQVRLYLSWAKANAVFPYLVDRIYIRASEPFPLRDATFYLDIWSDSPNATESLAIRKRIVELIDELEFRTTEVFVEKIQLQTDGPIPEDSEDIWHYAMQFNIRFYRISEASVIISR